LGFLSEQGVGNESSDSNTWGMGIIENIKPESVLNESAVFAFNARIGLSLNCNKTVEPMQAKFHSGIEFIAHFLGHS